MSVKPIRTHLGMDVKPDSRVEIDDEWYFFERVGQDGLVTFNAPLGSDRGYYQVRGDDGHPRKPTCEEVLALMAEDRLFFHEPQLNLEYRQKIRESGYDAEQLRKLDEVCDFRRAVLVALDTGMELGLKFSKASLDRFMADLLKEKQIAALPGAWPVSHTQLIAWFYERGTPGCRLLCDGVSLKGRSIPLHTVNHPEEISAYHFSECDPTSSNIRKHWAIYESEITSINTGLPLNRPLMIPLANGKWEESGKNARYDIPKTPYTAISESTFRRRAKEGSSYTSYANGTTDAGASALFGGGGKGDDPSHVGELCALDDTPLPTLFLVDRVTGEALGSAHITLMICCFSYAIVGWHLSWESPSSNTAIKTVLHANKPKIIPREYLDIDPNLPFIRVAAGTIKLDNPTWHHSATFRDAMADQGTAIRYCGSKEPRDKADVEGLIGIFQKLVTDNLAEHNYDIARARRRGFKPNTDQLATLEELRPLLTEAVCVHQTRQPSRGGLQPALTWRKDVGNRKLNKLRDVKALQKCSGHVEHGLTLTNSGIEFLSGKYGDAKECKKLILDYRSAYRVSKSDIAPAYKSSISDDRKNPSYKVKVKYDKDDIYFLHVWNPHSNPPDWVTLTSNDSARKGIPEWFHERAKEVQAEEAEEYNPKSKQRHMYAGLIEKFRTLNPKADEVRLKNIARAWENPRLQKMMSGIVGVYDADPAEPVDASEAPDALPEGLAGAGATEPAELANSTIDLELAAQTRKDALDPLPTAETKKNKSAEIATSGDVNNRVNTPARAGTEPSAAKRGRGGKTGARKGRSKKDQQSSRPATRGSRRRRNLRFSWKETQKAEFE